MAQKQIILNQKHQDALEIIRSSADLDEVERLKKKVTFYIENYYAQAKWADREGLHEAAEELRLHAKLLKAGLDQATRSDFSYAPFSTPLRVDDYSWAMPDSRERLEMAWDKR